MKIIVVGAGTQGRYISLKLCEMENEVTVIDEDFKAEELWSIAHLKQYPLDVVIGDACEIETLNKANLKEADVVLSCTGDDEDNLVISLLAKQEFGVPRVIARVNHPDNEWLFNDHWGIDRAVSPPHLITSLVEEEVSHDRIVELLQFDDGRVELVEITLSDKSELSGKSLAELNVPRECSIVSIVRNGHVIFPNPDTIIDYGDMIILLTSKSVAAEVREMFEV